MQHLGPIFGIYPKDLTETNSEATGRRLQEWVVDQIRAG